MPDFNIPTSTAATIPSREITEVLGVVEGSIVRSKHIGRDVVAGLKSLVGGEICGYSEMLSEARIDARKRMERQAQKLGADAIIEFRYSTSAIAANMSEVLAYGTAVRLR